VSTDPVIRSQRDAVCTLTLNRPDKLNALRTEHFDRLNEHLQQLESETDTVRCVVIAGAGRSFCAGADLENARAAVPEIAVYKSRTLQRMAALVIPVIAKVQGHCVGGGLELALCADLIVAAADARFRDAHGKWGLVPAWGLTQRLPRRVGTSAAKYLMFTGREVSGTEAHRIGLADLVVEADSLDAAVLDLAADISRNSAFTNREVKSLIRRTEGRSLDDGLAEEHFRYPRA
jgi:enoyl-CoA hydratase/carnithine racemase